MEHKQPKLTPFRKRRDILEFELMLERYEKECGICTIRKLSKKEIENLHIKLSK